MIRHADMTVEQWDPRARHNTMTADRRVGQTIRMKLPGTEARLEIMVDRIGSDVVRLAVSVDGAYEFRWY